MAYTLDFGISLGAGKAGITLAARLVDTAGSVTGNEVTTGFAEIGTGNYLWHYTAFPDSFRGGVKFYESASPASVLAFASINPQEAEFVDAKVSSVGAVVGQGAITTTITVEDQSSNPLDGVEVWVTTDINGANVVAGTLNTNSLGIVTFMLDAGTYYVWRQLSGYNFNNPVSITVS